jgi:hypothetical protein
MLINGQQSNGRLPADNFADLSNSTHLSLNQMHPLSSLPVGIPLHLQQRAGSLSQHNTLGRRTGNGMLTTGAISNYATISRAAHGQLMNGTHHFLNGGQTVSPLMTSGPTTTTSMIQQMPGALSHASLANGAYFAPAAALHQSLHPQSLYASSPFLQQPPQFVGLEAHLELVDRSGCCCFSSQCRQRCSLSRVILAFHALSTDIPSTGRDRSSILKSTLEVYERLSEFELVL